MPPEREEYRAALVAAMKELVALTERQELTARRIAHLRQTVSILERLMGRPPSLFTAKMSLSEACTLLLQISDEPSTPVAIKRSLQQSGVDFSRYTNPMAAIHALLKRLEKKGEIERVKEGYQLKRQAAPELTEDDIPF